MCISIGLVRDGMFNQPKEEIEASKDFSVIVAIHDSPEITRRCLGSLEKYGGDVEIILIDDNSRLQETIDLIQDYEKRDSWVVVRHDESMGHSRSCEAGCRLATRPYLCLLNSDTVVTPWSWSGITLAFGTDPRIAVVGPSTSWAGTEQLVLKAEYCRHYWNDSQIFAFAQKYVESHKDSPLVDLREVSGFAYFIRREIWESVGGFDKNLSDYGNETELNKRLLKSGWRLAWTRRSYIHHFGNTSYKEKSIHKRILATDYIKKKHSDRLQV